MIYMQLKMKMGRKVEEMAIIKWIANNLIPIKHIGNNIYNKEVIKIVRINKLWNRLKG